MNSSPRPGFTQQSHRLVERGRRPVIEGRQLHRLTDPISRPGPRIVIPRRRAAANPERIFQRPVFMDSEPSPAGRPGTTALVNRGQAFDLSTYASGATER